MNTDLYLRVKEIKPRQVSRIVGASLHNGIVNYMQAYDSSIDDLDYAELLFNILGDDCLSNEKFQRILINRYLTKTEKEKIAFENGIVLNNLDEIQVEDEILRLSKTKKRKAIARIFNIDIRKEVDCKFDGLSSYSKCTPLSHLYNIEGEQEGVFLSLHDYQKKIKDTITRGILEESNFRGLIHMPTGSGKTKTCIESIVDFIRTRPFEEGVVIWFAHSAELCEQAYYSFINTWKYKGDYELPVKRIFGNKKIDEEIYNQNKAFVFLGFQKFYSLLNSNSSEAIKFRQYIAQNAQLVVIDEAHKSLAPTYEKCIDYVSSNINCRVLGLTATPGRSSQVSESDNSVLANYFNDNLISIKDENGVLVDNPIGYLQQEEVLAKLEHTTIPFDASEILRESYQSIINNRGLEKNNIESLAESAHRNKIIVTQIMKALDDQERDHVLVFASSINHCEILKILLKIEGVESETIISGTDHKSREKNIARFRNGDLKVLINFGVLTTGFDAPKLKTLVIARYTDSLILYSQMIGRALRGPRNGGNKKNHVIDLITNMDSLGNTEFLYSYWESFWGRKL